MTDDRTVWRISAIERGDLGVTMRELDVQLVVDTRAEVVVGAIERAAGRAGIRIERVAEDEPIASTDVGFWEKQARDLLRLVEASGRGLADTSATIAEYGGDVDDLRVIIKGHGQIGEAMLRASKRTAAKFEQYEQHGEPF